MDTIVDITAPLGVDAAELAEEHCELLPDRAAMQLGLGLGLGGGLGSPFFPSGFGNTNIVTPQTTVAPTIVTTID